MDPSVGVPGSSNFCTNVRSRESSRFIITRVTIRGKKGTAQGWGGGWRMCGGHADSKTHLKSWVEKFEHG